MQFPRIRPQLSDRIRHIAAVAVIKSDFARFPIAGSKRPRPCRVLQFRLCRQPEMIPLPRLAPVQSLNAQCGAVGMTAEIIRLRAKNKCLQAELSVGRHPGESQRTEVAAMQQSSQAVERPVGLHSSNSDEPPSSDWQRKPSAPSRNQSRLCRFGKHDAVADRDLDRDVSWLRRGTDSGGRRGRRPTAGLPAEIIYKSSQITLSAIYG